MSYGTLAASTLANAGLAPKQDEQGNLQKVLDILGSKGGQTAVSGIGAGLQAYGQHKDSEANRAQSAQQFAAQMAQRQLEGDRGHQLSQATAGNAANPLGTEQGFAQQQALLGQLLGGARNFSVTPGNPRITAAMGAGPQGGIRLPEGGFDPAMMERLFGDKATLASLQQHGQQVGQINPGGPAMDLGAMFGQAGADTSQAVNAANQGVLQQQLDQSAQQRETIRRAIEQDIRGEKAGEKKKGNIFGKLLKGVGVGASFIPGVGQVVAPIASFAGGMVDGDGFKSSLGNAALSAVPMGLGKVAKAAGTASTLGKVANSPITRAILGGRG